eukprot:SAG31_NODE_31221_length_370_cov_2.169742_1_plen_43_part_10
MATGCATFSDYMAIIYLFYKYLLPLTPRETYLGVSRLAVVGPA